MPTIRLNARFTPNIATARHLPALARQMIALVQRGLEENARLMVEDLKQNTPRSEHQDDFLQGAGIEPPDGHVADGWTSERVDEQIGEFGIEVFNAHPRANEPRSAQDGDTTLMHILEYGSDAHVIEATNAPFLVFFWPAIGQLVRAKKVEHPGTRPFAMMAGATEGAIDRAKRLVDAAVRVLDEFTRGGGA